MKLPTYLAIVAFATAVNAAEKIEGAFGFKLGDAFSPTPENAKSTLPGGTIAYRVQPKLENRTFTEYYVCLTPTNRIYWIVGVGFAPTVQDAGQITAAIGKALAEKYGKSSQTGYEAQQGARVVFIELFHEQTPVRFQVTYADRQLPNAASQESPSVDLRGL